LDAQRSLHQQDYSQKRRAKSGEDVIRRSPPAAERRKDKLDRIRQDIIGAEKEGYSKDYLELIREYFEALSDPGNR